MTVPNRAPHITDTIPSVEVEAGDEATVDVSGVFHRSGRGSAHLRGGVLAGRRGRDRDFGQHHHRHGGGGGHGDHHRHRDRDPGGLGVAQSFNVTVPNRAPHITNTIPPLELVGGGDDTVDASDYFSDPDGDPLTFAAGSSNPGVAEVSVSGSSVTVTPVTRGAATITVTATDPAGLEAVQDFEVTVNNGSPTVTRVVPPLTLSVPGEDAVDATAHFSDPDGDPLTFGAGSSDPGVVTTSLAGSVVTIRAVATGTATITISAADPDGLESRHEFRGDGRQSSAPGGRNDSALGTCPWRRGLAEYVTVYQGSRWRSAHLRRHFVGPRRGHGRRVGEQCHTQGLRHGLGDDHGHGDRSGGPSGQRELRGDGAR